MDVNDDIISTFGHMVLAGVAGKSLSTISGASYTHPGMHANYLLYGLSGGLHFIAGTTGLNVAPLYAISKQAIQYIALPSLMADLYSDQKYVSIAHIASGLLPFVVAVSGNDSAHLSNFVNSVNIISLCYYAMKSNTGEYAWYTTGCGLVTYFGLSYVNALFPLGLAITEYWAYKLYNENFGQPLTKKERKARERRKKEAEKALKKAKGAVKSKAKSKAKSKPVKPAKPHKKK